MATRYSHSDLDDSDFEIINGRKCLKDGRALRVPVTLLDGMQRSVRDGVRVTDAGNGGSRPGYRFLGREDGSGSTHDAAAHRNRLLRDEKAKAHAEYHDHLVNAWRGEDADEDDNPVAARERRGANYSNAKVGQSCSIDGAPGRLVRGEDGKLYCRAIRAGDSVTDSRERMAREYQLYDARKAKEYVDPYPGPDADDDDVDAAFQATQSFANRPNRSAPSSDARTVAQAQKQHADTMDRLYDAMDRDLEQAWRSDF